MICYPPPPYRQIWSLLDAQLSERAACKLMVGALALAAELDQAGALPTLVELQQRFGALPTAPRCSGLAQHDLRDYDRLLSLTGEIGSQEGMSHG